MSERLADETSHVTKDQVVHIADLARLCPSAEEAERLSREMSQIVDFIGQLSELDTAGVEPLHHVFGQTTVLGDDEPVPSLPTGTALKNAPARKDDYFLVPKVIEK